LPDDIELAPYTHIDRIVKDSPIDINITRPSFFVDNKDCFSQKAMFNSKEYLDSFNNNILCSLKKSADPNAGLFANLSLYFSNVYDNIAAKNFLAVNTLFFYLSYFPESVIMVLYGLFGIFLWIGLYLFNLCTSIFYHIICVQELFRTTSEENDGYWETKENVSFFRITKLILFCFWFWVGLISAFLIPAIFTLYGLIAPLFATYQIKQSLSNQNKSYGLFDFIKDTFAYKKFFFFVLATLSLFTNAIKYLGTNSIIGVIIAVLFAYFMGLYTNEMPESGTDGFTNKIRQNVKQCSVEEINMSDPKLVEICKKIPIYDATRQKGKYRELTKPNKSGGYIEDTGNDSKAIQNQKFKDELKGLQTNFNNLPPEEQNTEDGNQLEKKLENVEKSLNQMGGRKSKNSKKYNIRWT
jgi:hypothetical protein